MHFNIGDNVAFREPYIFRYSTIPAQKSYAVLGCYYICEPAPLSCPVLSAQIAQIHMLHRSADNQRAAFVRIAPCVPEMADIYAISTESRTAFVNAAHLVATDEAPRHDKSELVDAHLRHISAFERFGIAAAYQISAANI